jgi:integrase
MRIPDSAVEVLLEHRSIQDEMRKSIGAIWNDNDLVFCNELGNPLDPSGVYHYYKRLTKRLGLDESRFHDLRHTFATIALQSGVDIKTIQESLGTTALHLRFKFMDM